VTGIVYLDIDDEITSAAARIRTIDDARIVLVLPSGSRLATSRINFRLLAREAQSRSRQLSIVAPEGATRALAASAGLPAYASVMEMEAALEEARPGAAESEAESEAGAETSAATSPTPAVADPNAAVVPPPPAKGRRAGRAKPADTSAAVVAEPQRRRAPQPDVPVAPVGVARPKERRTWPIVVIGLVALIAVVAAAAGYLLLPSASIVVTPRLEPIGPLTFAVNADPRVTAPDPQTATVPAVVETFPLSASSDFPATGTKVTETKATGTVTFTSRNTASAVTIAAGTQVSTSSGIVFVTTKAVTIPKAVFLPPTPGTADAPITAVVKGTSGNVPQGAITRTSTRVQAQLVNTVDPVNNAQPTSGGKHTEIQVVSPADVDKALTELKKQLTAQLDEILANPSQILPEVTVFPQTKAMTAPTPDPNPATLVNQQIPSFTLSLSATGSVTTVDESIVRSVAQQRLLGNVKPDRDLVAGSTNVTVGPGKASAGTIAFPVTATATQVRHLDEGDLRGEIQGHSVDDARAILRDYGDVTIEVWPSWVTTIPTLDFRLALAIHAPAPLGSPGPGRSAGPGASLPETNPSAEPSAAP
jgi:hypothetical protein